MLSDRQEARYLTDKQNHCQAQRFVRRLQTVPAYLWTGLRQRANNMSKAGSTATCRYEFTTMWTAIPNMSAIKSQQKMEKKTTVKQIAFRILSQQQRRNKFKIEYFTISAPESYAKNIVMRFSRVFIPVFYNKTGVLFLYRVLIMRL